MLRVRLLGGLEVELNGTVIDSFESQRPWALFSYVALAPRPVPRAEIANRFWPDVLDQSARGSLRSALWSLRRRLGSALLIDSEHVALADGDGLWIDVREFERLSRVEPEKALALCSGALLEGVPDEWATVARERQREREIELLEELALAAERNDQTRRALELTRRQVLRDGLDEAAQRRLIVRLDAAGDRAGALRAYQSLGRRLRRELGVAPSPRTSELVARLRSDSPTPSPPAPVPAPPPGLLSVIGRDGELAELERSWRYAAEGAGAAIVVRGEAGIGKTRLTTELRLRAAAGGARTATCAALDLGGAAPLGLWAELIGALMPALPTPPLDATWPEDLAVLATGVPAHFERHGASRVAVAPDLQRTRLFEGVVAMLGWAARERPLLLVLEDVHGADRPSLELAAYAARRLVGLPVMFAFTRRDLPHSTDADRLEQALRSRGLLTCELDLCALADESLASLARLAAPLGEAEVRRVVERAEGNALLAVATAQALARGSDKVPSSLRASARASLSTLSGEARVLVETTAVSTRALDGAEVAELRLQDPERAATVALESGMLVSCANRLGFRHALLREAVYEEIAEPRRRGLHLRWAQALLERERAGGSKRAAEVARQLRLAGADAEAVPQLVRAAGEARAVAALTEAGAYLQEALTITPERADLWLELGELYAWRALREEAEAAFVRALGLLEHEKPLTLARAWLRRGRAYHGGICAPRAVLESATNALAAIERAGAVADAERSEALAARAWAEAVAGSIDHAERLLDELALVHAAEDDPLRIYDVAHARALTLMRRGRFVESYAPSVAAGEAVARAGHPDLAYGCWANAASAACAAGQHERALEFLDRATAALAGSGLQSLEVHVLAARSFVLRGLDRIAEARAAAAEEQTLAESLAQPELLAMANHDRGLVALAAGQHETAAEELHAALVDGAPISRPLTRLALAEAFARTGRPERAAEELRETVLEPVRPSDFPDTLVPRLARVQGLIALAQGERAVAERRLAESIAGWERLLARTAPTDTFTTVLADLGRPVVGLVEPERELAHARGDLEAVQSSPRGGNVDAVVP